MRWSTTVAGLSLIASFAIGCRPDADDPLEGAWRHVEITSRTGDSSLTVASPQPSLYLFLERHYSITFVPGSEPRRLFAGTLPVVGTTTPTDAEKLAAYDSFIANAGTYELTDSTLVTHPLVARVPNVMAGTSITYEYRVAGDTLWLTLRPPWAPGNEDRYKLIRVAKE